MICWCQQTADLCLFVFFFPLSFLFCSPYNYSCAWTSKWCTQCNRCNQYLFKGVGMLEARTGREV
uniref:Uncharacterized protein n=1 Tax=Rhizophora mucronata TaxID=61149 RepID=A0A2P2R3D5_RHIMU